MERIKLSQNEKKLLRNIEARVNYLPSSMSEEEVSCSASALEDKGLIKVAWASGHIAVGMNLTDKGVAYVLSNPKLYNPLDLKWIVTTIIGVATLIVAIVALCIACCRI